MVGPMPTPAVAMLTQSMRADLGVMISASHNPFADNGIKLFGPDGYKLSDADEARSRRCSTASRGLPPAQIGRAKRIEDARGRYIHAAKLTLPEIRPARRAEGSSSIARMAPPITVAPSALWELGAEVVAIGVTPNGLNINDGCGSTAPALLQETVVASGADIGIALDGDADRLIVVDEKGKIGRRRPADGADRLRLGAAGAAEGRRRRRDGDVEPRPRALPGRARVCGWSAPRSATAMCSRRCGKVAINVGGEQSGHIILSDYATTGDGLVAALQVLAELVDARASRRASCSTCSSRCRNCSRMSASAAASRWRMRR